MKIKNFHFWFYSGVTRWLEIAQYKALQRINKAVELDQLEPVDNTVKYSSSAVDTLAIFYQVIHHCNCIDISGWGCVTNIDNFSDKNILETAVMARCGGFIFICSKNYRCKYTIITIHLVKVFYFHYVDINIDKF